MPLPSRESDVRRNAILGVVLAALLVVPTVLGFAVADAGESRPPTAEEEAAGPVASRTSVPVADQSEYVSRAPLSNAPDSAEEALTPRGGEVTDMPRLTFVSEDTGRMRVDNGGTVSLADGYELTVTLDPFPPEDFDVDVGLQLSRDGEPVTDTTIDTVWDMTIMAHGPFESRLDAGPDGTYSASYYFFMFGPWYVDTTVTPPGSDPFEFRLIVYVWPA